MGNCFGFGNCFVFWLLGREREGSASTADPQTVSSPSSQQTGTSPSPSQAVSSSQEIPPPPSLGEVIAQLKTVNDASNVHELIKINRDLLQWRTAGESVEDKTEMSQRVAPLFIDSGANFFRFLDKHVEKSSNKEDFVLYAPQIIGDFLEKLENVHWLVAGLSLIGSVLHTTETMSENCKRCLDLLIKLVDLSDHVKELNYRLANQEVKLKKVIVVIVNGCILCGSQISSLKLFQFLKASVNALVLSSLVIQINLCIDLITTALEQTPVIQSPIPLAYPIDAAEESRYIGQNVFLSHSGVQKNFVRQLYRDLTREGVSCFFDESRQSLPSAEKWAPLIFKAVETCRVAVLLLSMDFIQSKWPMLELSAFLKAIKFGENSNLKILPLFFKISPVHLTSDTKYIPYWTRLEVPEEKQIEWKEALREVRKINGLKFKEGEDEVIFRDKIIEEIRTLLPQSPIVSSMPVDSVGLAERREKVIELLQLTSPDTMPMAVVIYGFGGIGKTTLAEAVVAKIDLKRYHYTRVNFDIGSSKNEIKDMQQQILKSLIPNYAQKTETEFTDCCQLRTDLKEAFKHANKPIFLFIDNAPRKQDLEELLPSDMKGLPKGSRILVTTRHLATTDMFSEDEAGFKLQHYLVTRLSDQDAKDFLLKGRADLQVDNIQDKDVERILKICKGVPLVLKIIRGHLRKQGYKADKCSDILEALEKGKQIKEHDLSSTLTDFVYDQLEESSQQAFLDICCFFNGMDPSYVECIVGAQALRSLEEAGFVQKSDYKMTLIVNDIIRSDYKKTLIVHDIIRERGRNKAESTRIINLESLINAAKEQRLKDIRGVWLKDEPEREVEVEHLKAMTQLRVLALGKGMRVSHRCEVTFTEIRYLEVDGDIPCLPVNLERLPQLAFYVGPLFKKGLKLRKELRGLIAARQSDFKASTYSEESTSKALERLPESFGEFRALESLDLSHCEALERLPESFGELKALKILVWPFCTLKSLPESFGELKGLETLDLSDCRDLKRLPESFGEFKALKGLKLCRSKVLERLPESFGQLSALEQLCLCGCTALQCLPESWGELKVLKELNLSDCRALERLPQSFGQLAALEDLYLCHSTALQCLPGSFGELQALKSLDLSACQALQRLPESFGELQALKSLDLSTCQALQRLPESFGELKALESLYLSFCDALECLPESLGKLKALKTLKLCRSALERVPESFGQLAALEVLCLCQCTALECLPESWGQLKALKELNLSACKALERLPESLGELKALKDLNLSGCKALECLPGSVGELAALERLGLSSTALQRLPESFGELQALKILYLRSHALESLPESFGQLEALETLALSCRALQCLPESFGKLQALKILDLRSCWYHLECLPESLGQLATLEILW